MASLGNVPAAIRVGDVFRQSRDRFAAHWIAYCAIMALGYVPLGALMAAVLSPPVMSLLVSNAPESQHVLDIIGVVGVSWFVLAFICIVLTSAIINLGVMQEMRGRGVVLGKAAVTTLRRTPSIVATTSLVVAATLAGAALLLAPGLFAFCIFAVAIPACLAEKLGPIRSLARSIDLTKGNRWRVLAILCLLEGGGLALGELARSGIALIFGDLWSVILRLPVDAAIQAFIAVATSVLYMKLRVAREGLDVDHVATIFE